MKIQDTQMIVHTLILVEVLYFRNIQRKINPHRFFITELFFKTEESIISFKYNLSYVLINTC